MCVASRAKSVGKFIEGMFKREKFVPDLPESIVTGEAGHPHVMGMLGLHPCGVQRKGKPN